MKIKHLSYLLAEESAFFLPQYKLIYKFYSCQKNVSNYLTPGEPSHICLSKNYLLGIYFFDKNSKEIKVQSIPMMSFIVHTTVENLYFKFIGKV